MIVYEAINPAVLARLPAAPARVLDLGCGDGALGATWKQQGADRWVTGVTFSPTEAARAEARLDQVVTADLDQFDPAPLGRFDCVVCSHVLEHLRDPRRLLRAALACVQPEGLLIVALPNVLFWRQRWHFLAGRFRYTDGGLMDRTHLAFYDALTAGDLVTEGGWHVVEASGTGGVPLPGIRRLLGSAAAALDRGAVRRFPGLFAAQIVIVARPARTETR